MFHSKCEVRAYKVVHTIHTFEQWGQDIDLKLDVYRVAYCNSNTKITNKMQRTKHNVQQFLCPSFLHYIHSCQTYPAILSLDITSRHTSLTSRCNSLLFVLMSWYQSKSFWLTGINHQQLNNYFCIPGHLPFLPPLPPPLLPPPQKKKKKKKRSMEETLTDMTEDHHQKTKWDNRVSSPSYWVTGRQTPLTNQKCVLQDWHEHLQSTSNRNPRKNTSENRHRETPQLSSLTHTHIHTHRRCGR